MEQGVADTGSNVGGIVSLARIIRDYGRALEYDLMTRTGRTLEEFMMMGAAGKVALISFINYLPIDSTLRQAQNPKDEFGEWHTTAKTNAILADLLDVTVAAHTKKGRKPKTYPRPQEHREIGKGAIPIKDFWDWWNNKG